MREGWKEIALGDIVELGKGGSWGQDDQSSADLIQAVCLRGTDLAELIDKRIPDAPVRWIKESELRKSKCSKDMVLIETSGSKCGRSIVLTDKILAKFDLPVIYSNFCRTLTIDIKTVTREFVEIWFSHNYANGLIPSYRATSAMPNLDVKALLRVENIKVPPRPEQKRIVDLISSVDSYIEALKRQLESAKRSRNAVLHELLTAGGEGWVETKLGLIAEFVMGQAPLGARCNKAGIGTPFVKAGEFGDNRPEIVEWTTDPLKMAKQSDVLVCVVGATAGKINLGADCAIGRSVAAVRPGQKLHQFYLYYLLSLELSNLRSGSRGSAQGVITKDDLFRIPVSLPSINEQVEIVSIISSIDTFTDQINLSMKLVKNLRSGLLSDLLSGQHEIPSSYDKVISVV